MRIGGEIMRSVVYMAFKIIRNTSPGLLETLQILDILARSPDDPRGIRVASVFELSNVLDVRKNWLELAVCTDI